MTAPIGAMEIIHHSVRAARIGRGVVPDSATLLAYRPKQGLERDQGRPTSFKAQQSDPRQQSKPAGLSGRLMSRWSHSVALARGFWLRVNAGGRVPAQAGRRRPYPPLTE